MNARVLPITVFVSVEDAMTALGCAKTTAYEHLRAAARRAGRPQGQRGLLRVPVSIWEAYVASLTGAARAAEPLSAPSISGVYFVRSGALIKIGYASDLRRRVRQLRGANAGPLEFLGWTPGNLEEEARLHHLFAPHRSHGEWFFATDAMLSFIANEARTP